MTKGSDLLVAALENEGVDRIFGVPGEENLDVVESLRTSRIELIVTRHEQAAGFMAATHGRLTGRPGVCMSTLGPGALNFSTAAAYAHLGAMPMIMITGQKAITDRQAGALPDRRRDRIDEAADQDDAADRQPAQHPDRRARRFQGRDGGASRPGASGASGGRCGRAGAVPSVDSGASARTSAGASRRDRARGADDTGGQASADHDRRGRKSSPAGRPALGFRAADAHPVLQHADGQGRRRRRLEPLCRDGSAVGARLRARCHRALGPDHRRSATTRSRSRHS